MPRRPDTSPPPAGRTPPPARGGPAAATGLDSPRAGRRLLLAALPLAACALASQAPHLRFNLSPCLPRGIYYLSHEHPPRPGDLVLACPPARAAALALRRRYLLPGSCPGGTRPIGKLVAALSGDRLDLAPGGIAVDGRPLSSTASLPADSLARPLPRQAPGARRVAPGDVWLLSAHPRSFDSRYFGPVAAVQVLGTLTPLLTAGGADPATLAGEIRRAHLAGDVQGGSGAAATPPGSGARTTTPPLDGLTPRAPRWSSWPGR